MRSTILIFPRSNLRAVRDQPRRPRRDPLLLLVIGMDCLVLVALFGFWWMLVRRG